MKRVVSIALGGLSRLLVILPRWLFYFNSDVVALLLYYVARYRRDVVEENLRYSFPEKGDAERRRIARQFYRHLSDLIHESVFLMHASARRILARCQYVNAEALEQVYKEGKSAVVAAAHYNNWEFLTTAACASHLKMLSIYKPMSNKWVERIMTRSRERLGSEPVATRSVLRRVARSVKDRESVLIGLISDQAPEEGGTCYCGKFLNQETLFYRGAEDLARRYDFPVFYADMRRGSRRGDYVVHIREITMAPRQALDGWITQEHMRMLEQSIRECPADWLWSHRRWKATRK